jgi:hypothetical protein
MRKVVIVMTLVIGASVSGVPAGVAGPPIAGCPTPSWELRAAPSGGQGVGSFDQNRDGLSCYLEAPKGSGLFTVTDNVVR